MSLRTSILDPAIRVLKKFFWFCSGPDISILERAECSTEHNKYASIGSTVLLTALLASISGGYALFTVFRQYPQSIAFGILWGLLIFNLDRYIVLSMRAARAGNKKRILTALPRLVLAILISIVVTVPLELKIFDREISTQLNSINNRKLAEELSRIESEYQALVVPREAKLHSLEEKVKEQDSRVQELSKIVRDEIAGIGPTHRQGNGPVYREDLKQLEKAEKGLADAKEELDTARKEYKNDSEVQHWRVEKERASEIARAKTVENTGLLARLNALHELMLKESSTFISFCLLALLFLTLETAPVVAKFLSARGPYDAFLEAKEAEVVAREERRTSDAAAKAESDAQIDAAIRKKEFEQVQATLQAVSSDPGWANAIKQRLSDRFVNTINTVLPADDPKFDGENENSRGNSTSHGSRRWLKFAPIAILVLAVFGCLILLLRSLPRHDRPSSRDLAEAYIWREPTKGTVYLAVVGPAGLDPARLFPEQTNIRLQLADVKAPLPAPAEGAGLHMAVYTIGKHITSRHSLTNASAVPIVHLYGETHLGKSQLEEAARICKMLRGQEIDAIFLEQPDNLSFDWSQFTQLEANPDRAIAALQYQMRSDANSVPEMHLGKFDQYFREGDLTTPGGLQALEDKIRAAYGDDAVDEFRNEANEQLRRIKDSPGGRAYAESKYISAVDYLYVMTNLRKMGIPFYNVDSARLRDGYQPDGGLDERERFSARRIAEITRENGYHHVLYICGAFHLKGVAAAIEAAGLQSSIELNSLQGSIKEKIAALIHPELVVNRASREPPSGFGDLDLVLTGAPSDQLVNQLTEYLTNEQDGAFDADDISAFRSDFVNRYASEKLRERDKWSLTLVNATGNKALVLSWDKRAGRELDIVYDRDPTESDFQEITARNRSVHKLEYEDLLRAKETNQTTKGFLLATVRKNLSRYSVTLGDVIQEDLTASELVLAINNWLKQNPRKVIYLDLADSSGENDFEALSHSCQSLQGQIDPSLSVVAFNAVFKADSHGKSSFFSKKLQLKRIEPDVEIQKDKYEGWFAITLRFVAERLGGKIEELTVRVIVKSHELAMALFRVFGVISRASENDLAEMSPADIVARSIRQVVGLRPSDEDIRLQIFRELAMLERGIDGGLNV